MAVRVGHVNGSGLDRRTRKLRRAFSPELVWPLMPWTVDARRPGQIGGKRAEWLRSWQVRALTAAALTLSLLLGGAFALVDRLHSTTSDVLDHPADPVTDDQSKAQVV